MLIPDATALVPLGLGWLLVGRAPQSPVGAALTWIAATMVATRAIESWGETAGSPAAWWGAGNMALVGAGAWPWQLVGFMLLLLSPMGCCQGRSGKR